MTGKRALVIGGSLGGMIAAHLLHEVGWDAVVFERNATPLNSRGAGLGTHPALVEILHRVGMAHEQAIGVDVRRVICLDRAGRRLIDRPTARTMTSWGHLYTSLRARLPPASYRLGKTLQRVEQDRDGVTAVFADGERVRGDLLIAADGLRSTVREQLLPGHEPSYAGYVAWRIMLDERECPRAIQEDIFDSYCFCLPDGEQLLGYPVPGRHNETQIGQRAYNIVWYRPVEPDEALVDLCTDADGHCHPAGIPPPLIRPEVVSAIKAAARERVAPQIAEIVGRSQPFFQPIYDFSPPRMAFRRVVLLGDAAFVVRPHLGAGVTKAALDAAALADSVRFCGDDIEAACERYQHLQLPLGRGMATLAKDEGAYLSGQSEPQHRRTAGRRDVDSLITSHDVLRDSVRKLIAERDLRAAL